jgi:uncharacterized iron-regulated membrane protein
MSLRSENNSTGSAASDETNGKARAFYRAVWRCHFYAGLFVIPFVVILSITGIIYLFKPQLDAFIYRDLLFVTPRSTAVSAEEQRVAVSEKYPAAVIKAFTEPSATDRSSQFDIVTSDNKALSVFVDSYSGNVLGDYETDKSLPNYAFGIHGELMLGKWGDHIVELVASWAIVMMITGLYLWFPRGDRNLLTALLPNLRTKNKRAFWYGLHSSAGFYASLLILFMLISGLFWTEFWGNTFAGVWSNFPKDKNPTSFTSANTTGSLNSGPEKKIAWAAETMPLPESGHHEHHAGMQMPAKTSASSHSDITLDSVVAVAREKNVVQGYSILFPQNESGVFTISAPADDPLRQDTIHIDRFSGAVLAQVGWADYATVPRIVSFAISIHQGRYFGLANQILMLIAALAVLFLACSGVVMWWKRRPAKRLGAPPVPSEPRIMKTAIVCILALGILLPFVGISLLIVLFFDLAIFRQLSKLKRSAA